MAEGEASERHEIPCTRRGRAAPLNNRYDVRATVAGQEYRTPKLDVHAVLSLQKMAVDVQVEAHPIIQLSW